MRMKRHHLLIVSLSALVLATGTLTLSGPATTAALASAKTTPSFCKNKGPISASAVPLHLNLANCPIRGRLLVNSFAHGGVAGGLHVPRADLVVGYDLLTKSGEYQMTAANRGGHLTVSESYTPARATTQGVAAATDPACNETAYNLTGGDWYSVTDKWYLNEVTIADRTNLNVSTAVGNIRSANSNMTQGQNNCSLSPRPASQGAFQGTTSKFANINSSANCTSNFPDGQNTDSFGPFTVSGPLAETCWAYDTSSNPGQMKEADTYFGSNVGLVNVCGSGFDLQSVATHEWGHAYGLGHETSGHDEVMYPFAPTCPNVRRNLGQGDYDGMIFLYGFG